MTEPNTTATETGTVERIVVVHGTPDDHLTALLASTGLQIAHTTDKTTIWAPPPPARVARCEERHD